MVRRSSSATAKTWGVVDMSEPMIKESVFQQRSRTGALWGLGRAGLRLLSNPGGCSELVASLRGNERVRAGGGRTFDFGGIGELDLSGERDLAHRRGGETVTRTKSPSSGFGGNNLFNLTRGE